MPPPIRFRAEELRHLLASPAGYSVVVGERLRWFLRFAECGSVSATCREFRIARTTFYRWARRFDPADLRTLEELPQPDGGEWRLVQRTEAPECRAGREPFSQIAAPMRGVMPFPGPAGQSHQVEPASALSGFAAPSADSCPGRCLSCEVRRQHWRWLKHTAVLSSVLVNVVFFASLLTAALLEGRQTHASLSQGTEAVTALPLP